MKIFIVVFVIWRYTEGMKIKSADGDYLNIKPFNEGECPNCGQEDNLFFIDQWDKVLCEDCLEKEALKYHYTIEWQSFLELSKESLDTDRMKNKEESLKCDDCGLVSDTVEETICPYADDAHNVEQKAILCPNCYSERGADI